MTSAQENYHFNKKKMKKILSTALLMLFTLMVSAQTSLVGTWKNVEAKTEKQDWGKIESSSNTVYAFMQNNSFTHTGKMVVKLVGNDGKTADYVISLNGVGTWKQNGEKIELTYDPKNSKVNEEKNTLTGYLKLFGKAITKTAKKAISSKKPVSQKVVSVSTKTLVLKDLNDKNAVNKTFTKQ